MRQKEKHLKSSKDKKDKTLLFNIFKSAQYDFDRAFKAERKNNYKKVKMLDIENLCTVNPVQFWQHKKLGPYKRQNIPEEITGNDGDILTAPSDILNKWKHDFEVLYQSIDYNFENEFLQELILYKNFRESLMLDPLYYCNNNLIREISVHEVSNIVLKAKNGKAVGIDKIPNEVFCF